MKAKKVALTALCMLLSFLGASGDNQTINCQHTPLKTGIVPTSPVDITVIKDGHIVHTYTPNEVYQITISHEENYKGFVLTNTGALGHFTSERGDHHQIGSCAGNDEATGVTHTAKRGDIASNHDSFYWQAPSKDLGMATLEVSVKSESSGAVANNYVSLEAYVPAGRQNMDLQRVVQSATWRDGIPSVDINNIENNFPNVQTVMGILTEEQFNFLFVASNKGLGPTSSPYNYENFLKAIAKFPYFCGESDSTIEHCQRSLAVMFAHMVQETGAQWPGYTKDGQVIEEWRQALWFYEEYNCDINACSAYNANCRNTWAPYWADVWPCQEGALYYGRGAHQLSWNYNYGPFSHVIFNDPLVLLKDPGQVLEGWLAFASATWFFVTPQPPKPSIHEVIYQYWEPNAKETQCQLIPGFGVTTNIINGALECGKTSTQADYRVKAYKKFCDYFEIDHWYGGKNDGEAKVHCRTSTCNPKFPDDGSYKDIDMYFYSEGDDCVKVSWQTPWNMLLPGAYRDCVKFFFKRDTVDPCAVNNGGCSDRCVDNRGEALCVCSGGIMGEDGMTCSETAGPSPAPSKSASESPLPPSASKSSAPSKSISKSHIPPSASKSPLPPSASKSPALTPTKSVSPRVAPPSPVSKECTGCWPGTSGPCKNMNNTVCYTADCGNECCPGTEICVQETPSVTPSSTPAISSSASSTPASSRGASAGLAAAGSYSFLTCHELGWNSAGFGSEDICASAQDAPLSGCTAATWDQASNTCTNVGARLCTVDEIVGLEGKETGCDANGEYVWTSSTEDCMLGYASTALTNNPAAAPLCHNKQTSRSVVCCADKVTQCSDLGWDRHTGSAAVCAAADVGDGCSGPVSHTEALVFCRQVGARLCTSKELLSNEAEEKDCQLDFDRVWTSDSCESASALTQSPNNRFLEKTGGIKCSPFDTDEPVYAMCCSDQEAGVRGTLHLDEILVDDFNSNKQRIFIGSLERIVGCSDCAEILSIEAFGTAVSRRLLSSGVSINFILHVTASSNDEIIYWSDELRRIVEHPTFTEMLLIHLNADGFPVTGAQVEEANSVGGGESAAASGASSSAIGSADSIDPLAVSLGVIAALLFIALISVGAYYKLRSKESGESGGMKMGSWGTGNISMRNLKFPTLPSFKSSDAKKNREKVASEVAAMNSDLNEDGAWKETTAEDGEVYYYNVYTGATSWDPPLGFEGAAEKEESNVSVWQTAKTDEGETYYFNATTGETSWDEPTMY